MNLQENIQRIKEVMLLEQGTPFLAAFPSVSALIPDNQKIAPSVTGGNNTNIIYLTKRDQKGNILPNTKFSYKVSGSYGFVGFDINLRNVKRNPLTGALTADVMPKNNTVKGIMMKLIPKDAITADGWLNVYVSTKQINDALTKLHNNDGSSAEIKVGNGVGINLEKV
jgi:nitrogen fixation protein